MSTVLYEAGFWSMHFISIMFFFVLFLGLLALFYFKIRKDCKNNKNPKINAKLTMRIVSIICLVISCELVLVCGLFIATEIHKYNHTVVPYREGNYQVAEGYVECFEKYPADGSRIDDVLVVDNYLFEYSIKMPFESYPEGYDGPVLKVGQYIRVKFVEYGRDKEKVIMSIEDLSTETDGLSVQ